MPRTLWLALALLLAAACVRAAAPAGAELEQRSAALAHQLRCVVCQNQSIADSQADLAVDLRREVRDQLARGRSEQQVIDYMVERYGEFVLYKPPVSSTTWLLWAGPALLLAGGLLALVLRLRRPVVKPEAAASADLAAARRLLDHEDPS